MSEYLRVYLSGLLMGAADIVPGVSGGTIAFILGIYDRLISALSKVNKSSIKMLMRGDIKALWQYFDGGFLFVLGAGVLSSIFALSAVVSHLLSVYPMFLFSFFFGLILTSAYLLLRQINGIQWRHVCMLCIGTVIGVGLSFLAPMQLNASPLMVFFSGLIAICAMILPGVSGSFLLLMMGMYGTIIASIKNLEWGVLLIFAFGALVGLLSFSKLLNYLLSNMKKMTLSLLTGVMLGALVKVWPWKMTLEWVSIGGKNLPSKEHLIWPWQLSNFQMVPDLLYPVMCIFMGSLWIYLISYIFLRNATNRHVES